MSNYRVFENISLLADSIFSPAFTEHFIVIPVKLGIIGVVNRSQLDITNNKVCKVMSMNFNTNYHLFFFIDTLFWFYSSSLSLSWFFFKC